MMRHRPRWMIMVVGLATAMLGLMVGCGDRSRSAKARRAARTRTHIVASIQPLGSLAEQLVQGIHGAGDQAEQGGEVEVLLPPGRSPHGFELTPHQVKALAEADMLIVAGDGLDTWAETAAKRRGHAHPHRAHERHGARHRASHYATHRALGACRCRRT